MPDSKSMSLGEAMLYVGQRLSIVRQQSVVVLGCLVFCVGVGLIRLKLKSPEYEAQVKLLPYRNAAISGGLSGLANIAGVRLPTSDGSQTVSAELYPELAKMLDFKVAVAESELTFSEIGARMSLLRYFGRSERKGNVSEQNGTREGTGLRVYPEGVSQLSPDDIGKAFAVASRVMVTFDRRTNIVVVKARLPDAVAAAELAHVASQHLMDIVRAIDVTKAKEHLQFIERAHATSENRYNSAQLSLARYVDRNRMQVGAVSSIERLRLERDAELAFEAFQQYSRELDEAKARLSQDTPAYSVLERATVPGAPVGAGLIKTLITSGIVGMLLGLTVAFLRSSRFSFADSIRRRV